MNHCSGKAFILICCVFSIGCEIPEKGKCPCAEEYVCCIPKGGDTGKCMPLKEYETQDSCNIKLTAHDLQRNDKYGSAVSISGNVAIVGAPYEDGDDGDPKRNAGAAYIYKLDNGAWLERQKITAHDAHEDLNFGISVSVNKEVAIIGAIGRYSEAAYIFRLVNGQWVEMDKFPAIYNDDRFGSSVSICGDVAIVGAPYEDGGDWNLLEKAGAVYIFHWQQESWEMAQLTASDAQALDEFGISVSISGNVAIVGARNSIVELGDSVPKGAAYIFQLDGGKWVEKQKLIGSDANGLGEFGKSVSISGDVAIVGAPNELTENEPDAEPSSHRGTAYIFNLEDGRWIPKQKLMDSGDSSTYFGKSVSINGSFAIIGAPGAGIGGTAYVFHLENGIWVHKDDLTAPDSQYNDQFGSSVSIGEKSAIVGAPEEDGKLGDLELSDGPGAAYIYRIKN